MDSNEVKAPVSINVQFVVNGDGNPTAVLMDIDSWNQLLQKLQTAESQTGAVEAQTQADANRWDLEKAGYRTWQSIREEMHEQLLREQEEAMKTVNQDRGDIKIQRCC